MFLDASAIVALIAREPGHEALSARLFAAARRLTSGLALYEAALAVGRPARIPIVEAEGTVRAFLRAANIVIVSVGDDEAREALSAFARFGKGRGHPARLNLGDCFAYACARTQGVPLLFVGDDFTRTDIPDATA